MKYEITIGLSEALEEWLKFHTLSQSRSLARIEQKIDAVNRTELINMHTLDEVLAETAKQTTIEDSMEALLKGLKDAIDAAHGDQSKIDAAFAALSANNTRAAAAITANTPAAPVA